MAGMMLTVIFRMAQHCANAIDAVSVSIPAKRSDLPIPAEYREDLESLPIPVETE